MLVWMLAAPLMGLVTVLVGVPVALVLSVRQSRGGVLAAFGWWAAARYGIVEGFAGPFRLPWVLGLPVAAVFGWMFARNLVKLVGIALGRAWSSWVMFRLGVPPREVV